MDGNIDISMLEKAIRAFGINLSPIQLKTINEEMKPYEMCNFNQYAYFIYHISRYYDLKDELTEAFRVFDRDGTGMIKESTARMIFQKIDHPFEEIQMKKIFKDLEVDNGFINYNILIDKLAAD
jgi:Ca2+-binding EF-hand superfamily protein